MSFPATTPTWWLRFSTTALQTALRKIDRKPVVFGVVLDPIAAGAGKSDSDHKKGVTGVYLGYPYPAMVQTIRQVLPKARRVGTLFTPGEINSVLAQKGFVAPLKAAGLELVSLPVNGPTEVATRRSPSASQGSTSSASSRTTSAVRRSQRSPAPVRWRRRLSSRSRRLR